ncbi:thiamine pyrophosphate-dependent dehydrogenase E1 component subunit alpha [Candidatus Methylomirabilis sp.]|uniref:thiamine pyrophosphate-dependent dehydrogenase E1 component subunit alpha n=1 Tax=Candidatus Methylomirabilis sp. TaxID=2032687 RepID=UPI002A5BFC07|nr:thiamine pyrophosphate-dependent dehydrogenase E1 component subunit alpha [Candidatus Methylomirabilis sp.]
MGVQQPTPAELLNIYYYLKLTRGLEQRVIMLYRQGKIVGGVYLGTGEEAIGVGSASALEPSDVIAPTHRDLGANLMKGITPKEYMAQYLAKQTGLTRGRDGNVHFGDITRGVIGFISPMADLLPVAAGVALAFKIRRERRVAAAFFGDGASSRGDFHEALNLAAVLKLPVVFICHNNQYAYSTPLSRQMAIDHIADRAKAYGMPGISVDGNDVLAVRNAVALAVARARMGEGPSLVEGKTMRMRGHAEHDDASYVPPALLEEWRARDPIDRFTAYLRDRKFLDDASAKAIDDRIAKEIEGAVLFAESSPLPNAKDLLDGVYAA